MKTNFMIDIDEEQRMVSEALCHCVNQIPVSRFLPYSRVDSTSEFFDHAKINNLKALHFVRKE